MKRALRALMFPSAVVGVTLAWIWLDRAMGWRGIYAPRAGAALVAIGVALALWCAGIFFVLGQGSPHPFVAKTKRLVDSGPYGVVRNPMMYGVGMILVGLALWLDSLGLWFGFAGFLIFVSLFVPRYEERDMERRFGDEYRDYCRRVPRWLPRLW